jgi:hypothetical protein
MSISTGVETTPEEDPAALPGPRELPAGARPVEGVAGDYALIHGSQVTVFGPDGTEFCHHPPELRSRHGGPGR